MMSARRKIWGIEYGCSWKGFIILVFTGLALRKWPQNSCTSSGLHGKKLLIAASVNGLECANKDSAGVVVCQQPSPDIQVELRWSGVPKEMAQSAVSSLVYGAPFLLNLT
jgi:hypothetical protein